MPRIRRDGEHQASYIEGKSNKSNVLQKKSNTVEFITFLARIDQDFSFFWTFLKCPFLLNPR